MLRHIKLILGVLWFGLGVQLVNGQLRADFYAQSCPNAVSTVTNTIKTLSKSDNVVAPSTLRLLVHDCFVQGCDASILIKSTADNTAERDATDNKNIAQNAHNAVIKAKQAVEAICPGVVSCADVLALAARDAVVTLGGPTWDVPLGRKDGLVSKASLVGGHLPGPNFNVAQLLDSFAALGLDAQDMVVLSGGHTIGFSHCDQFANRLYNFDTSAKTDPSMNPAFVTSLQKACPQGGANNLQPFDVVTPFGFDNQYYKDLQIGKGLLLSDQILFTDNATRAMVDSLATSQEVFFQSFVKSMIKMTTAGVKVGSDGEIRKDCTVFNSGNPNNPSPAPSTGGSSPPTISNPPAQAPPVVIPPPTIATPPAPTNRPPLASPPVRNPPILPPPVTPSSPPLVSTPPVSTPSITPSPPSSPPLVSNPPLNPNPPVNPEPPPVPNVPTPTVPGSFPPTLNPPTVAPAIPPPMPPVAQNPPVTPIFPPTPSTPTFPPNPTVPSPIPPVAQNPPVTPIFPPAPSTPTFTPNPTVPSPITPVTPTFPPTSPRIPTFTPNPPILPPTTPSTPTFAPNPTVPSPIPPVAQNPPVTPVFPPTTPSTPTFTPNPTVPSPIPPVAQNPPVTLPPATPIFTPTPFPSNPAPGTPGAPAFSIPGIPGFLPPITFPPIPGFFGSPPFTPPSPSKASQGRRLSSRSSTKKSTRIRRSSGRH